MTKRGIAAIALVAGLTLPLAGFLSPAPVAPAWQYPDPSAPALGPARPPGDAIASGPDGQTPSAAAVAADPAADEADGDEGMDPSTVYLQPNDGRIQVYPDRPSVLPGQALRLHTSTTSSSYSIRVYREGTSAVQVFSHSGYRGRDYRAARTVDTVMHTVRANWPVSVSIPTRGWRPGVYTVYARDSSGRSSGTVFAVRSPSINPAGALFVLPVMDYQAYNGWGVGNFYSTKIRSYAVSFDRPYNSNGGLSLYPNYDRYTLRWLLRHGYPLAFTTDYDLAMHPPATAPRVLVIPQHTEYVTKSLFDWVDAHVNGAGDMNVAYFGANSFYWQVRLVPGPAGSARPYDIVCYKSTRDPIGAVDPSLMTVRWASPPVNRPEAALFGGEYSGVVDGGHIRHNEVVTAAMPAWARAGTGWRTGTQLTGLLLGEADRAQPESGGVAISRGTAPYRVNGTTLTGTMTIRVSAAGGRVFDAGTFIFGGVLGNRYAVGVSYASFDRFARNVMGWLGLAAAR